MPRFCPNCGAPVEENAAFCTQCGARLDETPAPADVTSAEAAETPKGQPAPTAPAAQPAPEPAAKSAQQTLNDEAQRYAKAFERIRAGGKAGFSVKDFTNALLLPSQHDDKELFKKVVVPLMMALLVGFGGFNAFYNLTEMTVVIDAFTLFTTAVLIGLLVYHVWCSLFYAARLYKRTNGDLAAIPNDQKAKWDWIGTMIAAVVLMVIAVEVILPRVVTAISASDADAGTAESAVSDREIAPGLLLDAGGEPWTGAWLDPEWDMNSNSGWNNTSIWVWGEDFLQGYFDHEVTEYEDGSYDIRCASDVLYKLSADHSTLSRYDEFGNLVEGPYVRPELSKMGSYLPEEYWGDWEGSTGDVITVDAFRIGVYAVRRAVRDDIVPNTESYRVVDSFTQDMDTAEYHATLFQKDGQTYLRRSYDPRAASASGDYFTTRAVDLNLTTDDLTPMYPERVAQANTDDITPPASEEEPGFTEPEPPAQQPTPEPVTPPYDGIGSLEPEPAGEGDWDVFAQLTLGYYQSYLTAIDEQDPQRLNTCTEANREAMVSRITSDANAKNYYDPDSAAVEVDPDSFVFGDGTVAFNATFSSHLTDRETGKESDLVNHQTVYMVMGDNWTVDGLTFVSDADFAAHRLAPMPE